MEANDPRPRAPGLPSPLPDAFMQMVRAWQDSRIVLSALELDLFTAIGSGGTAAEIARRAGADPRGADILLHALAALGLVEKRGDTFANGALAAGYLTATSPHDRRAALRHLSGLWHRWSALTECVKSGRPAPREGDGGADPRAFIAAMHNNAAGRAAQVLAALDLAGARRALDLGGGSGAYAIALARAVPGLAVVVLDLPEVVPLTEGYVAEAGLSDRITVRSGDLATGAFGTGFDLVLLSAVCHMNGPAENADLLRRAAAALVSGGRLVVHDYVLEPDRTAPRAGAVFAVNMLVNTETGGNYTEAEYFAWLAAAGLVAPRHVRLVGAATGLVIGTRP